MSKKWFALCTRPQQELKVASVLSKKGIDTVCPLTRKMLVSNGFRKRISHSPVFPGVVFVYVADAEMSSVLRTADVTNFMFWMGKPAVVAASDIDNMQHFAARYPNVTVKKTAVVIDGRSEATGSLSLLNGGYSGDIEQALPSIGFVLIASRERNYRIINSNIERGKTTL